MTTTNTNSDSWADQTTAPIQGSYGTKTLKIVESETYTHGTADTDDYTIKLVRLPAGKITVYPGLSYIKTTAFEANADLHIGFSAYTDPVSGAVNADDNAFADNLDVGGGALSQAWADDAPMQFNTVEGLDIQVMVDTADIEADDTVKVWVAYTEGYLA